MRGVALYVRAGETTEVDISLYSGVNWDCHLSAAKWYRDVIVVPRQLALHLQLVVVREHLMHTILRGVELGAALHLHHHHCHRVDCRLSFLLFFRRLEAA